MLQGTQIPHSLPTSLFGLHQQQQQNAAAAAAAAAANACNGNGGSPPGNNNNNGLSTPGSSVSDFSRLLPWNNHPNGGNQPICAP